MLLIIKTNVSDIQTYYFSEIEFSIFRYAKRCRYPRKLPLMRESTIYNFSIGCVLFWITVIHFLMFETHI
jgi:hypothetical protein